MADTENVALLPEQIVLLEGEELTEGAVCIVNVAAAEVADEQDEFDITALYL